MSCVRGKVIMAKKVNNNNDGGGGEGGFNPIIVVRLNVWDFPPLSPADMMWVLGVILYICS